MVDLSQDKKPEPPKIKEEAIPKELKKMNQWCCWFYKWNGKKWTKPPCDINGYTGDHHQMNYTFKEVLEAYKNNEKIAGIGISMRKEDKLCGIDIDHVVNDNKIKKKAKKIIKNISTYWEISPSGEGLRAFGFGKIPTHGARKNIPIETYREGRYLTVTGNNLNGSTLNKITKSQTRKAISIFGSKAKNGTKLDNQDFTDGFNSSDFVEDKQFNATVFNCKADSYQTWIDVGFAIHHKYQGSKHGLALWRTWSTGCEDKFEIGVCEEKWQTFGKNNANPLTIATILFKQNKKELESFNNPLDSNGAALTIKPTKISKLRKEKHKKISYYLGDTFPNNSVCMVHASRGVGKSFFCMSIGLAVSNHATFLKWLPGKEKKVLYIEGELPRVKIQEMVETCATSIGLKNPNDNFSVISVDDFPNSIFPSLSEESGRSIINQVIETEKPELLIIDSLATCFKFRDERQSEWLEIQNWLLALRANGISTLLVHHDNKAGTGQRGFSNKEDVMDTVLHLKQSKAYNPKQGACFNVFYSKHRYTYGDSAETFQARLKIDSNGVQGWVVEKASNNNFDAIIDLIKEGFRTKEAAERLGISYQGAKKHMDRAVKEGLLKKEEVARVRHQRREPPIENKAGRKKTKIKKGKKK